MLTILMTLIAMVSALDAVITVMPDTVGMISTMELTVTLGESLGRGGSITVELPEAPELQVSDLNKPLSFNQNPVSCKSGEGILLSCQVTQGNSLTLLLSTTAFLLARSSLTFTLTNACQNPSSLAFKDKSLAITTKASSGGQIERQTESLQLQSLSPGPIANYWVEYSRQTLGARSEALTVSFRNLNPIPDQGKIELRFPARGAGLFLNSNYSLALFTVAGIDYQVKNHQLSSSGPLGAIQTLSIQGFTLAGKSIASNTLITISISEFNNPIEKLPPSGLVVQTFDNLAAQIDESKSIPLIVMDPAKITSATVKLDSGSATINQKSGLQLAFWSPIPLSRGCQLRIHVPQEMASDMVLAVSTISVSGLFGEVASLAFTVHNNHLIVKNACSALVMNDKEAIIKIKSLMNPPAVQRTGSFKIEILDQTSNLLAESAMDLVLEKEVFEPGKLLVARVLPGNQTAGEANAIMIQMQLNNKLEQQYAPFFKVKVPGALDLSSSCEVIAYSAGLSANARCIVEQGERAIIIQNASAVSLSSGTGTLVFQILGAVHNPQTKTENIGNFTVATYINSDDLVDIAVIPDAFAIGSGELYGVSMQLIPSLSSSPNPKVSFSFQNQHQLVSGSEIKLFIPSEELSLYKVDPMVCTGQSIDSKTCQVTAELEGTNYVLTVETNENLQAFSQIQIQITNIFEEAPRFMGQLSKPIMVQTRISNRIIDEYSKLYLKVDNAQPMAKRQLGLTSETNLAPTGLLVDIELKVEPRASDWLRIEMPTVFKTQMPGCPAPFSCESAQSGEQYFVKVTGFTNKKKVSFEIKGFQNPESTKQFGPFTVGLFDERNREVQKSNGQVYLKTSIASSTSSVRMIQSNTQPSLPANYTLTIERNYQPGDVLPWAKLTLPDCIQFSPDKALKIYDQAESRMISPTNYGQFDYVFQLHTGINFYTLLNLINPQESCLWTSLRLSFEYRTYEDPQLQYIMASRLSGLEPSLSCQAPCSTCQTVDKTFCKSCRAESGMLLLQDVGKCVINEACPLGYWLGAAQECRKCSQGCSACDKGACTSCDNLKGYVLDEDAKCIKREACDTQNGFTISDGVCQRCHSDCATCGGGVSSASSVSDSPLFCGSCSNSLKFLHYGQCLATCPPNFAEHTSNDIRICEEAGSAGAQNQSSLSQARLLLSASTESVIKQVHPITLLAHFPMLLVLLFPSLILRKCQQTGRTALSGREIALLSLQSLEYLGTIILGIKGLVSILEFQDRQVLLEQKLESDFILVYMVVSLMSASYFLLHHLTNEYFYRQFLLAWEDKIREDFHEEFATPGRCCCTCQPLTAMRYWNYSEWIVLWRQRGGIIPETHKILRDKICYLFIKVAQRSSTSLYFLKYSALIGIAIKLRFGSDPDSLFVVHGDVKEYLPGQKESEKEFSTFTENLHDFLINQIIEVVLIGLSANFLMQKWLIEGDIVKLEESWEEGDTSSCSEESEEEEESDEESDTARDQSSSCSHQEIHVGLELASVENEHPKGEMRVSSGLVSPKPSASGRQEERSSPQQSLRRSMVEDSFAQAIDRQDCVLEVSEKQEAAVDIDINDIPIKMHEPIPKTTEEKKKRAAWKDQKDMSSNGSLESRTSKLEAQQHRPNYNSEGDELEQEPEPTTTDPVRPQNDTQMADFTYRSVEEALGFDTRRQPTQNTPRTGNRLSN